MPLLYMSAVELNDSISLFVFEVKNEDASEYPANSVAWPALYSDIEILDTVCV